VGKVPVGRECFRDAQGEQLSDDQIPSFFCSCGVRGKVFSLLELPGSEALLCPGCETMNWDIHG